MKKYSITLLGVFIGSLFFTFTAFANTTALLTPASVDLVEGDTFDLVITIDTKSIENFTEKIEINFPPELLEIQSFDFAEKWMALSSDGYDLINNENGTLIKTGGYPGGISGVVEFGTISFTALKAGDDFVKVGNGSLAFEIDEQIKITGNDVDFSITAPVVPVTAPVEIVQEVSKPAVTNDASYAVPTVTETKEVAEEIAQEEVVVTDILEVVEDVNIVVDDTVNNDDLASTAGFKTFGIGILLGIFGTLLIVLALGYYLYRVKRKA